MTPKQLTKSIEVTEKAIAKATKNIAMYESRRDNAIAKANKAGFSISTDSFKVENEFIKTTRDGKGYTRSSVRAIVDVPFDVYYPIVNAWESMLENARNLEREERRLAELQKELDAINAENKVVSDLASILENAMSGFKKEWFAKMQTWHTEHHNYINSVLSATIERRNRMKNVCDRLMNHCGFTLLHNTTIAGRNHGKVFLSMRDQIRKANEIIMDKAAGISLESYLEIARAMTERAWGECMKVLVGKLERFNINVNAVKVDGIGVTSKGFECYITDNTNRRIYARMIWAAEYSVLVQPHTRYIITEKKY